MLVAISGTKPWESFGGSRMMRTPFLQKRRARSSRLDRPSPPGSPFGQDVASWSVLEALENLCLDI
jgi:hypothetical protein